MAFVFVFVACGPGPERLPRPARGEWMVCAWHLDGYGLADRNGDGLAHEMKPEPACRSVGSFLNRLRPDVLCVQDIGNPEILRRFEADLVARGLSYPFRETLAREDSESNLALFSRFPIVARRSRLDHAYSIGSRKLLVERGFLDVDLVINAETVTVVVAQLKSKDFHPAGQTEMRRNEARLLGNRLQRRDEPRGRVLVAAHLADQPHSRPWDELAGPGGCGLTDLRPTDGSGNAWTERETEADGCARSDYLFADPALAARAPGGARRIIRDPEAAAGSRHAPLVVVFRTEPRL